MICPRCKMKMNNTEYCFRCGYMSNGNIIDTNKKMVASDVELYFGKYYDKYTRNKNWIVSGLLGPVYIFCHGYYIRGLLLICLDILVSLFFMIFNHAFLYYFIVIILNLVYWFFNRMLWAAIGNMIYIRLLTRRLEKIKSKNSKVYEEKLQDYYKSDNKLIVLKYIIFEILFLILFFYLLRTIYDALGLM